MSFEDPKLKKFKTFKSVHASSSTWRKVFLVKNNPLYEAYEKVVYDRSSTVLWLFKGELVKIYSGKRFFTRAVNRWMIGFKFGEFTWNRKIALYKAKQLKKKLKSKK
jgi:ribosomal protein S19